VPIDLVIFDCDGVLVDSEVISCRAHAEALTDHGYPITPDQVLDRFLGMSDREARLSIEAELGRKLPDDFDALMKQAELERYTHELRAAGADVTFDDMRQLPMLLGQIEAKVAGN
jgi:beta-phosphoglucomutase-like phosphatase (HAD superfamily)